MHTLALGLCLQLGIMGIITPYASGPSPVYYGSGYLPAADYWRLGAIFGVIFFVVFLAFGVPWMLRTMSGITQQPRGAPCRERRLWHRTNSEWSTISSATARFRRTPITASRQSGARRTFISRACRFLANPISSRRSATSKKPPRWRTGTSACSTPRSPMRSSARAIEVIAGEMLDQFVTDFIQGGAGTSTNMNANEVIANLAPRNSRTQKKASTSTSIPMTM